MEGAKACEDPVGDDIVDFLFTKRRETPELDFKWVFSVAKGGDFAKLAKDILAMANYGGGHIVFGFREDKNTGAIKPEGLPAGFHVDQADIQEKMKSYLKAPLTLPYREFEKTVDGVARRFALLYVTPSTEVLKPESDGAYTTQDGKIKTAFKAGQVLVRRGTQSAIATPEEECRVAERAKGVSYQISLLSGEPDRVSEKLYSDLFRVERLPSSVYSAELLDAEIPFDVLARIDVVLRRPTAFTFDNPLEGPLREYVWPHTVARHDVSTWTTNPDNGRVFVWMLENAILREARARGIYQQRKPWKLFFPLHEGHEKRLIRWKGLHRSSERQVAHKFFFPKLGRSVGVHAAVRPQIRRMGGQFYIRLEPSMVLTEDGRHPAVGPEEGAVLTSLGASEYNFNKSQLRNILFWVSQFTAENGKMCFGRHVEASARPIEVTIDVGIWSDLPTALDSLGTEEVETQNASI